MQVGMPRRDVIQILVRQALMLSSTPINFPLNFTGFPVLSGVVILDEHAGLSLADDIKLINHTLSLPKLASWNIESISYLRLAYPLLYTFLVLLM